MLGGDGVIANGEIQDLIGAVGSRGGLPANVGEGVGDRDLSTSDGGAGFIGDVADDPAGSSLSGKRVGEENGEAKDESNGEE